MPRELLKRSELNNHCQGFGAVFVDIRPSRQLVEIVCQIREEKGDSPPILAVHDLCPVNAGPDEITEGHARCSSFFFKLCSLLARQSHLERRGIANYPYSTRCFPLACHFLIPYRPVWGCRGLPCQGSGNARLRITPRGLALPPIRHVLMGHKRSGAIWFHLPPLAPPGATWSQPVRGLTPFMRDGIKKQR